MDRKPHNQCDECRHWHKGYMLHRSRVPSFCNRHFHSQRGDDPACAQFEELSDEEELGISGYCQDGSPY
jgi:hypothetical protein